MTTLTWDRHRGHASGYDVVALGFNYRIDEPRAALATARLARLDAENAARHRLDLRYREALAGVAGRACRRSRLRPAAATCPPTTCSRSSSTTEFDRDAVRAAMAERGVQTSLHYPPAHRFSIYAAGAPELPVTDAYAARAITLPMFAALTDAQQDLVVEALDGALRAQPAGGLGDALAHADARLPAQ